MSGLEIALVGAGLGFIGNLMEADAQADQAREQAFLNRMQADEILRREEQESIAIREDGSAVLDAQVGGFAAAGVDVGSGSPLLIMENTRARIERAVLQNRQAAQFEADQLRRSAQSLDTSASTMRSMGILRGATNLFSTVGRIGLASRSSGSPGPSAPLFESSFPKLQRPSLLGGT